MEIKKDNSKDVKFDSKESTCDWNFLTWKANLEKNGIDPSLEFKKQLNAVKRAIPKNIVHKSPRKTIPYDVAVNAISHQYEKTYGKIPFEILGDSSIKKSDENPCDTLDFFSNAKSDYKNVSKKYFGKYNTVIYIKKDNKLLSLHVRSDVKGFISEEDIELADAVEVLDIYDTC